MICLPIRSMGFIWSAYPSGAWGSYDLLTHPEHGVHMICLPFRSMKFVWLNFSFLCSCSTSLFVFWTLFVWPLYCLSFFWPLYCLSFVWPLYCLSFNLRLSSDYPSSICKLFLNIFWPKLSICTSIQTNLITYSGVQHVLTVYMSNLAGVL
jgi:hypothetical protein